MGRDLRILLLPVLLAAACQGLIEGDKAAASGGSQPIPIPIPAAAVRMPSGPAANAGAGASTGGTGGGGGVAAGGPGGAGGTTAGASAGTTAGTASGAGGASAGTTAGTTAGTAGGVGGASAGTSAGAGGMTAGTTAGTSAGAGGMAAGTTAGTASGAGGTSGGDPYDQSRQDCVDRINGFRSTLGLPALARWTAAEACTDMQAQNDQTAGSAHANFGDCDEWAQNTCPGWSSIDGIIQDCFQSMWDEGPPPVMPCTGQCYTDHGHYINMSSTGYTKVACGFYEYTNAMGKQRVWHNSNFR